MRMESANIGGEIARGLVPEKDGPTLAELERDLASQFHRIDGKDQDLGASVSLERLFEDRDLRLSVKRQIKQRNRRSTFFGKTLFADPAWDMLLDLYSCHLEQVRATVGSVTVAANVPQTTGLRWLQTLAKSRLIVRSRDMLDGRRVYVELTDVGVALMTRYFKTTVMN